MPLAVFRADAAPEIGGGHVMRCLTLAAELRRRGWRIGFAVRSGSVETVPALNSLGVELLTLSADPSEDGEALAARWPVGCELFVLDHYGLGRDYERARRRWAQRLLVMDDAPGRQHSCDFLLDASLGRRPGDYDSYVDGDCNFLCGARYALLRAEFAAARSRSLTHRAEGSAVRRVLIAMGATDPDNATSLAMQAVAATGLQLEVDVVLGPAAPWRDAVRQEAAALGLPVTMYVGSNAIAELISSADVAIGSAGGSTWERCCLGLPSILVLIAEHQRRFVETIAKAGAVVVAGFLTKITHQDVARELLALSADARRLSAMSAAAAALVDGLGASRVCDAVAGMAALSRDSADGCRG